MHRHTLLGKIGASGALALGLLLLSGPAAHAGTKLRATSKSLKQPANPNKNKTSQQAAGSTFVPGYVQPPPLFVGQPPYVGPFYPPPVYTPPAYVPGQVIQGQPFPSLSGQGPPSVAGMEGYLQRYYRNNPLPYGGVSPYGLPGYGGYGGYPLGGGLPGYGGYGIYPSGNGIVPGYGGQPTYNWFGIQ